jgi:hypothetical protein
VSRWHRWRRRWRVFRCGLGGHVLILSLAPDRLALRCALCPHETPGWGLRADPPRVSAGVLAAPFVLRRAMRVG